MTASAGKIAQIRRKVLIDDVIGTLALVSDETIYRSLFINAPLNTGRGLGDAPKGETPLRPAASTSE